MSEPTGAPYQRRGLFDIVGDLPRLFAELVRAEIAALKAEFARDARRAALGIGLIAAALVLLVPAGMAGVIAAVAALALVLPTWAAALIVCGAILLLAAVLMWIGVARLRKTGSGTAKRFASIADDIAVIKGTATVPGQGED